MLLNHSSVKQIQQHPIVVQWLGGIGDVSDTKTNFVHPASNYKSQTGSPISPTSPTEELELEDSSTANQQEQQLPDSIYRLGHSDRWACNSCKLRDDKWGMMKHYCRAGQLKQNKESVR
jgi:hypothetical protein